MKKFMQLSLACMMLCGIPSVQAQPSGSSVTPPKQLMTSLPICTPAFPDNAKQGVRKSMPSRKPAENPTALGNIVYSSDWTEETYYENIGMYSIPLASEEPLASVSLSPVFDPNGGGLIFNGQYCFIHYMEYNGFIFPTYYKYDLSTWSLVEAADLLDISLFTTTSTYDPTTGNVYAICYGLDHDGFDLGIIDYDNTSRTTIGTVEPRYLCIACSPAGEIFGISKEGNLYSIDKATAKSTLIGDTGLRPVNYFQSATFDLRNNKLYWAFLGEDKSGIYTIDTTTGKAEPDRIFAGMVEIMSLYIAPPEAAESAPDRVENLAVSFNGPSLVANVEFQLPTTNYAGESITSDLPYSIKVNGVTAKEGSGTPGEKVATEIECSPGSNTFEVRASNESGEGPAATTTLWAGYDYVVAEYSDYNATMAVDGMRVAFTWSAPTQSANGGYVDWENLKYIICCYRNQECVSASEAITERTFSAEITDQNIAEYYWTISTVNGDAGTDEMLLGHTAVLGHVETPFFDNFDENTQWPFWTTSYKSGGLWTHDSSLERITLIDSYEPSDVWAMTPPIELEKDKYYQVEFLYGGDGYNAVNLQAAIGEGDNPETYTLLFDGKGIEGTPLRKFDSLYKADSDGLYRLGFHSLNDTEFMISIDSVRISAPINPKAPEQPFGFKVTPAEKGVLKATLQFTLPETCADGSALSSISRVVVLRDDEWIADVATGVIPGETIEYTDENALLGRHHYRVAAVNEYGTGLAAEAQAYIGVALPGEIAGIHAVDDNGHITLTWDIPAGEGGAYIDDESVAYTVTRYFGDDTQVIAENIKARTVTDEIPTTGQQRRVTYGIIPKTAAGEGLESYSYRRIAGEAHMLPFKESFANAEMEYDSWWHLSNDYYYPEYFTVTYEASSDNDGGAVYLSSWFDEGCTAWLNSGKISMQNAKSPVLAFDYWLLPEYDITLGVEISTNEIDMEPLEEYSFLGAASGRMWCHKEIDLSGFANAPYIVLHFKGETHAVDEPCIIDCITLSDKSSVNSIYNDSQPMWPSDIYGIDGRLVKRHALSADGLNPGIYIVKGKKLVVR